MRSSKKNKLVSGLAYSIQHVLEGINMNKTVLQRQKNESNMYIYIYIYKHSYIHIYNCLDLKKNLSLRYERRSKLFGGRR